MNTTSKTAAGLFVVLCTTLVLAACGTGTAEEAGEIILLSHYVDDRVSPVAASIAQVENSLATTDSDGVTRVTLEVDGRAVTVVEYPSHAQIVRRLEDTAHPPVAAILVVAGMYGVWPEQHGEQLRLAKAAGVPVVAVLLSQVHMIDDEELLDLMEDPEIKDTLAQAGYAGVPVVRGSAEKAVEGDAQGRASIQELVTTVRQQLGPILSAR